MSMAHAEGIKNMPNTTYTPVAESTEMRPSVFKRETISVWGSFLCHDAEIVCVLPISIYIEHDIGTIERTGRYRVDYNHDLKWIL